MAYQDRQKAMFIANAVSRLSRDDSWEYLVVLDATLKANKASPLKAPDWQWAFAAMQNARNMGARQRPSPFPSSISYVVGPAKSNSRRTERTGPCQASSS